MIVDFPALYQVHSPVKCNDAFLHAIFSNEYVAGFMGHRVVILSGTSGGCTFIVQEIDFVIPGARLNGVATARLDDIRAARTDDLVLRTGQGFDVLNALQKRVPIVETALIGLVTGDDGQSSFVQIDEIPESLAVASG